MNVRAVYLVPPCRLSFYLILAKALDYAKCKRYNVQQLELPKVAIHFLQGFTKTMMTLKTWLDELIVNLYLRVNLVLFSEKGRY